PMLEEAMGELGEKDRSAVLLRFFEGKSLGEVGAALGVDSDAARKRVGRAVEKLRGIFIRRGCAIPAAVLTTLLTAKAVHVAPIGLASTISTSTLFSGAALSHASTIALTKTVAMTTIQKTLIAAVIAGALGTGIYDARRAYQLQDRAQTLERNQKP